METNEIIKKRRQELGLTLKDVAQALGVAESTVLRYERKEIKNMGIDKIVQLAGVLKCSPSYLMGWEHDRKELLDDRGEDEITAEEDEETVKIKVLGSLPAGVPLEDIEDVVGYERIPAAWQKGGQKYIGLMVKDDSTYPRYLEDDLLFIYITPEFRNNLDAIVYLNDADATLRQVHQNDDGSITLKPYNPEYPTRTFPAGDDSFVILGYVRSMKRTVPIWNVKF